jgi:hypothetical protein
MRDDGPSAPGTWTKRRRRADLIMAFCAGASLGLTVAYPNSPLVSAYCMALVALLGATYTNYSVGAVIDDQNARKAAQAARDGEARQPSSNQ